MRGSESTVEGELFADRWSCDLLEVMSSNRISKSRPDEVFVIRRHNLCVRVAEMIDAVNRDPDVTCSKMPVSQVLDFERSTAIDEASVERMADSRRDQPVIVLPYDDGYWLVDGNHRLLARARQGFADVDVVIVSEDLFLAHVGEFESARRGRKRA